MTATRSITEIIIEKQHQKGSDGFRHGYDEYRAAVILANAAPNLLETAKEVLANWEQGDLAQAVRHLSAAIANAEEKGK